jgi:hypothetical protein
MSRKVTKLFYKVLQELSYPNQPAICEVCGSECDRAYYVSFTYLRYDKIHKILVCPVCCRDMQRRTVYV